MNYPDLRFFTTLVVVPLLALAFPTDAKAQGGLCGQRDRVVQQLAAKHGEIRQSFGLQRDGRVMETFANRETGSWTVLVSLPSGVSCLVAAGEAWDVDPDSDASQGETS